MKPVYFPWIVIVFSFANYLFADVVVIKQGENELTLTGEILVEAQNDNGLLFQTNDGKIWPLQPESIVSIKNDDQAIASVSKKEMANRLKRELGDSFKVQLADNFVIAYNTEKAYARWVAGLYRRLEKSFKSYWTRKSKFKLSNKPPFPLGVIIFRTQTEYLRFMKGDLGGVNPNMLAYYNLETNLVVMYDITADELPRDAQLNDRRITDVLNTPRAIPMVATIIHEGTHQLMFNYGMQTRFSDTPLWLNEGLAMYFETPDLSTTRGWRTIGIVNPVRLKQFLSFINSRPPNSLEMMLSSDEHFRNEEALDYYAQAWAFSYFLLAKHKKKFVQYLKHMSKKPRLIYDTPEQRIEEFQSFFDVTLDQLDREFVQFARGLDIR
ncbi:MAG: DUF1570 domain-containing protein [Planctomycetota bacterium]